MIFADIFSTIFTILLLVGFVIYFLAPDFISETKEEEILVKESIYGNDNIFVIKSFLNTPSDEGRASDSVNHWLLDTHNDGMVFKVASETLDKTYGECYQMSLAGHLFLGHGSITNKAVCLDYPNYDDSPIQICLDISEYEKKLYEGVVEECF